MAKYIKVALIGGEMPFYNISMDIGQINSEIISHFTTKLEAVLPDKPDLIVFPEMCDFSSECSMEDNLKYIRNRNSDVLNFIMKIAKDNKAYVAYSTVRVLETNKLAQTIYFIDRNGKILELYDKYCLTIGEIEDHNFQCGNREVVVECDLGRVCFAICFDLNFSYLCEKYRKYDVDLIIFSSAFHGGLKQNYWAFTNSAYFLGAVNNLPCSIISPDGLLLSSSTNYNHYIIEKINMDYEVFHLDYNWDKIKAAKKKYGEKLRMVDPGLSGSIVLYSETTDFTMDQIKKEFDLEPLNEYLLRSIEVQNINRNMN